VGGVILLKVKAEIYFLTEQEGGMKNDVRNGFMPSFDVNGDLIMCRIISNEETITRGKKHIVEMEFPYGEVYSQYIVKGYEANFHVGSVVLGHGKILDVIQVTLDETTT